MMARGYAGLTVVLAALAGAAQAQAPAPGIYRVGQTVNAHDLIVCADDMDAEDIVDGFKTSDQEAAKEFALTEKIKEGGESACKRLDGEKVKIAGMPVAGATRTSDRQKAAVVKIETSNGRSYFAVLFGDYKLEAAPPAPPTAAPPPPAAKKKKQERARARSAPAADERPSGELNCSNPAQWQACANRALSTLPGSN
jgi:hypothetical protein